MSSFATRSFAHKKKSVSSILGAKVPLGRASASSRPKFFSEKQNSDGKGNAPALLPPLSDSTQSARAAKSVVAQQAVIIDKVFCEKCLQLTEDITQVSIFVNDNAIASHGKDYFQAISEEATNHLLNIVSKFIFRPPKDMNVADEYSDEEFSLPMSNWKEIKACHVLFQQIMAHGIARFNIKWLKGENLECAFDLLLSPDPREEAIMETTILAIYKNCPVLQSDLFSCAEKRFLRFLSGFHTFYGISSVLRFIEVHYQNRRGVITVQDNTFFKSYLVPLLIHDFSDQYYAQLSRVIGLFYQDQAQNGILVLEKMFKRWPVTCTAKLVCFIHQMSQVSNALGSKELKFHAKTIFMKLIDAAKSSNHKVCIAAFKVASNLSFVFEFMGVASSYIRALYDVAQESTSHWSNEVRESARQAIITISNAAPQIKQIHLPDDEIKHNDMSTWSQLSDLTGMKLNGSIDCL